MTSVAVIGDVHGNATALHAALEYARRFPYDQLVFMGDLLTYGHDVNEVIAMIEHAQTHEDAVLLIGNHDQMYFDLARGDSSYLARLPGWIRDSVERTLESLDVDRFMAGLRWTPEHVIDGVLFAHANPFGGNDWAYVESAETLERARAVLHERAFRAGVFGHTHRPRWNGAVVDEGSHDWRDRDEPLIANVGAIGQPRDQFGLGWVARFTLEAQAITCAYGSITYDLAAHLKIVNSAGLQPETVAQIVAFFARARRTPGA